MSKEMRKETIEKVIGQLDGMIAAFGQAVVIGGRNKKETEAYELLKDARLKLVEDMEQRYGDNWMPGWAKLDREELARQHQHEENERLLNLPSVREIDED
jgi:hypothetical protein